MSEQATVRQLPNGDIWQPRYAESKESANMRVEETPEQKPKSRDEKVAEAVRVEGDEFLCPWCGQGRESSDAIKEHILARHSRHVESDEMPEMNEAEEAAYAASRRRATRERAEETADEADEGS